MARGGEVVRLIGGLRADVPHCPGPNDARALYQQQQQAERMDSWFVIPRHQDGTQVPTIRKKGGSCAGCEDQEINVQLALLGECVAVQNCCWWRNASP